MPTSHHTRIRAGIVLVLALAFLLEGQAPQASAAAVNLTVTTLQDVVNPNDGQCSLREAMGRAFDNSSNNTIPNDCPQAPGGNTVIKFGVSGTIFISSSVDGGQLPNIVNTVTIIGPVTLDAAAANQILLDVESNGRLNLVNLTIKNSKYTALDNRGEINLANVTFENNGAGGAGGGAIRNDGTAMIAGGTFTNNRAVGAGMEGGAIRSTWKLTIAGSTFTGNTSDKNGGAIAVRGGWLEIADSTFSGNVTQGSLLASAIGEGGGALYITDSTNTYPMTVKRSTFSGNYATQGVGGALFHNANVELTVSSSSFQGNGAGSAGAEGSGGAIRNVGILILKRVVFLANSAIGTGGAISNDYDGQLTLRGVGFTGNNASGKGGAIANLNGSSSVASISAIGAQLTGNVSGDAGGGLYNHDSKYDTAEFRLSVWAGNLPQNCRDQNSLDDKLPVGAVPPMDSKGQNSFSDDSCEDGDADPSDQHNADPQLEDPADNGGAMPGFLTQKPQINSPLVDAVAPAAYPTDDPDVGQQDLRGSLRPQDGNGDGIVFFDIGPFELDDAQPEFGSLPPAPGPVNLGNVPQGQSYTKGDALAVYNSGGVALSLSGAALSGTNAGDFAVTFFPAAVAPAGVDVVQIKCTPSAPGARSAVLSFNTNDPDRAAVSYNLLCNGSPAAGFDSTPDAPGPVETTAVLGTPKAFFLPVKETGGAALTLSSPSLTSSPPGAISLSTAFPVNIANGGAPVNIALQCAADALGLKTGTLTFSTNDPAQPTVTYNLVCKVNKAPQPFFAQAVNNAAGLGSVSGPYGLAISPDGRHVYAADAGDSALAAYSVGSDNTLASIATYASSALGVTNQYTTPYQLAVSPDGLNVYVTGSAGDSVAAYTRNADNGTLTYLDTVREGQGYGCTFTIPITCDGYIAGLDGAYGLALSPDGRFGYVTSINGDSVVAFQRSAGDGAFSSTGLLSTGAFFVQRFTHPQLNSAYGLAMSPDGANVYVTGYTSDSLLTLKRSTSSGQLSAAQVLTTSAAAGLNGAFRVLVSPDGNFVYTAAFDSDSVCVFRRSAADGKLTYLACTSSAIALDAASDLALMPDGKHLLISAYNGDGVAVFARDARTGLIGYKDVITGTVSPGLDGARGVIAHPNGRAAYATGYLADRVVSLLVANPQPVINTLVPASRLAGSTAFTLTVNGADFTADSVVRLNGVSRPTTFMNETQLQASLSDMDVFAAGTWQVSVSTPAPGGGVSNNAVFTVLAAGATPIPAVGEVSVQGAVAGSGPVTVDVWGSDFTPGSVVLWNGSARPTTFLSDQHLSAVLSAADLAQPGTGVITVQNTGASAAGDLGAQAVTGSAPLGLSVVYPNQNPLPGLTGMSPAQSNAMIKQAALEVTLTGTNFQPDSRVLWNSQERPAQFVNNTTLVLTVSAGDLALPGVAGVNVVNPAPAGGQSNARTFTILEPDFRYWVYVPLLRR